jgi:hypothetical protein
MIKGSDLFENETDAKNIIKYNEAAHENAQRHRRQLSSR